MSMFGRTHNQITLIGFAGDKAVFTNNHDRCIIKVKTFDEFQNENGQWSYEIDWHHLLIKNPSDMKTALSVEQSTQLMVVGKSKKIAIEGDESELQSGNSIIVVDSLKLLERQFTTYEKAMIETMEYDDSIDSMNAPALSAENRAAHVD